MKSKLSVLLGVDDVSDTVEARVCRDVSSVV